MLRRRAEGGTAGDDPSKYHALGPLQLEDVPEVLRSIAARTPKLLQGHGLLSDDDADDDAPTDDSDITICTPPCSGNQDCPGSCCALDTLGTKTCVAPAYKKLFCPGF